MQPTLARDGFMICDYDPRVAAWAALRGSGVHLRLLLVSWRACCGPGELLRAQLLAGHAAASMGCVPK